MTSFQAAATFPFPRSTYSKTASYFSWASLNFTQAADIHGSVVWTILGLHSLDAVADLLFTLALIVVVLRGHHGAPQRLGVHVDAVVWYFVVLIWIPLYVVVYWGPALVGTPG